MSAARATSRSKGKDAYLAGVRVSLRPVLVSDLNTLAAWDDDPEIVKLMGKKFDSEWQTPGEWYRRAQSGRELRALAIEDRGGGLIGLVELDRIDWRGHGGEVRILIGEKTLWGMGLGRDALLVLLQAAFGPWGFRYVYLRVYRSNRRAVRCYLGLGFSVEGVLPPSRRRGDTEPVQLMMLSQERFLQFCRLTAQTGPQQTVLAGTNGNRVE